MYVVGQVINFVLFACIILLLARFVLDWVQLLARQWRPSGFVAVLCEGIYAVTDPPLRAVRKVIPPVRIGSGALDLSPMVLLIGIYILQAINSRVFFAA
ncbi:MAG: YggT family protein [Propionibacteriales bacterium]|nr:YggT family protein [Propionibacteriales bacterium]